MKIHHWFIIVLMLFLVASITYFAHRMDKLDARITNIEFAGDDKK